MNPRLIEMAGQRFGEWLVIEKAGNTIKGAALWRCQCNCGTVRDVIGVDLRANKSLSCGCKSSKTTIGTRSRTHGMKGTRLHTCWQNMLRRCRNLNNKHYGGKGITVCTEWSDFETFYSWAMQSGYSDSLTIERKNNAMGYSPANCTWATKTQQARNRTIVKMADAHTSWAEIAQRNGIPVTVMNNRIAAGKWSIQKAATTPIGADRDRVPHDEKGRFAPGRKWRR